MAEVDSDPARLDMDVIHGFLTNTYWSPGISRERVERAVRNSLCFGVYEGDRQVGFARVVTDQATFAYLADVFIVETHRGQGLAKALMSAIVADARLQGLRRWMLATRDAHALYERYGFTPLAKPQRFMELHRPDA
jgi:GNAT superfamily N-acetyltransferase